MSMPEFAPATGPVSLSSLFLPGRKNFLPII
jgi:hypothetical protein